MENYIDEMMIEARLFGSYKDIYKILHNTLHELRCRLDDDRQRAETQEGFNGWVSRLETLKDLRESNEFKAFQRMMIELEG